MDWLLVIVLMFGNGNVEVLKEPMPNFNMCNEVMTEIKEENKKQISLVFCEKNN